MYTHYLTLLYWCVCVCVMSYRGWENPERPKPGDSSMKQNSADKMTMPVSGYGQGDREGRPVTKLPAEQALQSVHLLKILCVNVENKHYEKDVKVKEATHLSMVGLGLFRFCF